MKKLYNIMLVATIGATSVFGTINTGAFEPIEIYASTNEIKVTIDGKAVDFTKYNSYPKMVNGTTYVPLRSVFEALGAVEDTTKKRNVLGDEGINNPNIYVFESKVDKYDVILTLNTKERMQPFESYYTVNYKIGTAGALMDFHKNDIIVENGRTYLPLRGISEAFGYEVKWDSKNNTVAIDTSNPTCEGMQILDRKMNEYSQNTSTTENTNTSVNNNTITTPSNNNNNIIIIISTSDNNNDTAIVDINIANEILELVNIERKKAGVSPLILSEELTSIAQTKSDDMIENNYFSHTSPTYGSPFDMLKEFGMTYRTAGENIAQGQQSAQAVMESWMNSKGHKENILNPNFEELGVGYSEINGIPTWVQIFIKK